MAMAFPRFAAALLAALALTGGNARADTVVIGQCAPLSGSLASTGKAMALGVRLAIETANAAGGINGHRFRHALKDDGYQTAETLRLSRELIQKDKAAALIGYAGTGNILELLRQGVLAEGNIALVAPYTGGEPLRDPYNPWIFHIRASYGDETAAMVTQLVNTGLQRIAVFHQDDPFGQAGLAGVEKALARHRLKPVSTGRYAKNSEDVSAAVTDIARGEPQAVIMIGVVRPTAAFVRAYRSAHPGTQLFSISVINGRELHELAGGDYARGVGITQVMPSPFSGVTRIARDYNEALQRFAPGEEASYTSFEEYVGARILLEAIRRVRGSPTPAAVMQSLEKLELDLGGFAVRFAPGDRLGSRHVEVTLLGRGGAHLR
ncbi:ABC transporter substrate-binding protein [Zoogloea sp.]|uniref:ABC transporter substrate-binding protein n=1 Tax=Zoogloea sp. TaxID=49181 RepID=UPI0031FBFB6A